MKKLKQLLIALLIILSPLAVKAANNLTIDSKSYNENSYEFNVSGTSSYSEIMVSLFDGENLLSFKTVSANNNKYTATFDITFEQDKTITIKVGDINSTDYKISTLDVKKSETHLNNVLTDESDNQLIIKGTDAQFRDNEKLNLMMISKEELEEQVRAAQGTEDEEEVNQAFNIIKLALEDKELVEFLQIRIEDERDNEVDYNSHMSGFTLKINIDKDTYNALGKFEVAALNMETGKLGNPITYSYDEDEEMIIINIDKPGILLVYAKEETKTETKEETKTETKEETKIENKDTKNPTTSDTITTSFIVLILSFVGIVGTVKKQQY